MRIREAEGLSSRRKTGREERQGDGRRWRSIEEMMGREIGILNRWATAESAGQPNE